MPRSTPRRARSPVPAVLLGASLPFALAACCDGDSDGGSGLGPPGGTQPTALIDFELRTDALLDVPLVSDALVVDVNGDGVPDLVEVGLTEQRLTIGLASGLDIVVAQQLPTPGTPLRVVAVDLAGDGAPELAVLCFRGDGGAAEPQVTDLLLPAGTAVGGAVLGVYRESDGEWFLSTTVALDEPAYDLVAGTLGVGARERLVVPQRVAQEVWVLEEAAPDVIVPVAVLPATGAGGVMGPLSVALIDDGDGLDAIAVGLYSEAVLPGAVSVFRQTAPLAFAPEATLPVLAFLPVVRALPDVIPSQGAGGSGAPDLAVADAHAFASAVQLLAGEDALAGAPLILEHPGASSSAAAADFDGDGVLDLAFTLFDSAGVTVRLGDGAGGFDAPRLYSVGPAPRGLQPFDLDVNGRADLAVVTTSGASLMLALPDGRMRAAEGFDVGLDPEFVSAVDLDGDGFRDAVTIDVAQRAIAFLKGLPERKFELVGAVPLAETDEVTPASFVTGELTGDAFPDVLVAANETGVVHLLRGGTLPPAPPGPADTFAVGPSPRGLDVGDIDGDGDLDALVAVGGLGALRVLTNDGTGALTIGPEIAVPGEPLAVRVVDLDADGLLDAVVSNDAPAALVLRGDGTGAFELVATHPLPALCISLRTGDLVVDGLPDVLLGQTGLTVDSLVLLENTGGLGFVAHTVPVGMDPGSVELVDIDGDGVLDILSPTGSEHLALLGNDGRAGFSPLPTLLDLPLDVPFMTRASTMVDLDFDGLPELLMVSPFTRQLWVARNNSVALVQ